MSKFFVLFAWVFVSLLVVSQSLAQLQVYMIPHSHLDPGWLRTIEEYRSDVHAILQSVIGELQRGAHRTFIWGEVVFFKAWYEMQSRDKQKYVRHLIQTRRFEIVSGGWVQNDEACPSYTSIIDQMTVGHEYLMERFGVKPRVAWQIDPFGHDSRVPQLYAEMGIDSLVINRVHHKIKQVMKNQRTLEFLWNVDGNRNHSMLTHVLHTHYSAPAGYDFENSGVEHVHDGNVMSRAQKLVEHLRMRAESYLTNHIMVPFGDDFKFKSADTQFTNMDKLIDYINNKMSGIKIRYSTPSEYFDILKREAKNTQFPVFRNDFFPYADNEDSYWTGYYTTLPVLKKRTREGESALASAETAMSFARMFEGKSLSPLVVNANWLQMSNQIQTAREDVSVVQHHDGITGTCRTHVYHDYLTRLQAAISNSKNVERYSLAVILGAESNKEPDGPIGSLIKEISDDPLKTDAQYGIIIHNSISASRRALLRIKCSTPYAQLLDHKGKKLQVQINPVLDLKYKTPAVYDVNFAASIDGFAVLQYKAKCLTADATDLSDDSGETSHFSPDGKALFEQVKVLPLSSIPIIANDRYEIVIDPNNGYMRSIKDKTTKQTHMFTEQFLAYNTQRSGSYIFRPVEQPRSVSQTIQFASFVKGSLFDQFCLRGDHYSYCIRLPHAPFLDNSFFELSLDIAPLGSNLELVTRLPLLASGKQAKLITFDGLQFLKRMIYEKAPLASRFYPVVAGAMIQIQESQLNVVIPQTMGATVSGNELELMVHRRLMSDDGRGMSQANNDDSSIQFSTLISYSKTNENNLWVNLHSASHSLNNPLTTYKTEQHATLSTSFRPLVNDLDPSLKLVSLKPRDYAGDDLVLRVHNVNHATPKRFQLDQLFPRMALGSLREKSLSLMFDIHHGQTIHNQRVAHKHGDNLKLSIANDVAITTKDAQNTQEEGVFLSDEALRLAGRKLFATSGELGDLYNVVVPPGGFRTFLITLTLKDEMERMVSNGGILLAPSRRTTTDTDNTIATTTTTTTTGNEVGGDPLSQTEPEIVEQPVPVTKPPTQQQPIVQPPPRQEQPAIVDIIDYEDKKKIIAYLERERSNVLHPSSNRAASGIQTQFSFGLIITVLGIAGLFLFFLNKMKKKRAINQTLGISIPQVVIVDPAQYCTTEEFDLSASKKV